MKYEKYLHLQCRWIWLKLVILGKSRGVEYENFIRGKGKFSSTMVKINLIELVILGVSKGIEYRDFPGNDELYQN